ncbi:MAG: hypothetical protein PHI58_05710 [Candidatus Omnitrophica bacterium]|nr:hypothetical protein [Candidatus Omnitrophota bacterium]
MKWSAVILAVMLTISASACSLSGNRSINITDAKIVTAVDEKLMPVQVMDKFQKGTTKVVCWFQWKDAKVNTQVIAKWHYVTDDIHILDYTFSIPKKTGSGSVTLSAPEGKTLPAGEYKIELTAEKHSLRSLKFTIE